MTNAIEVRTSARMWKAILFVSAILASAVANATIIAAEAGGSFDSVQGNNPEGISWSQTGSYTGVSISAVLSSAAFQQDNGAGTVYLTNSIGPGTTAANQIASIVLSGIAFANVSLIPLFSGLTLGPGTYYLITASDLGAGGLGWTNFNATTAIQDVGVTISSTEFVYLGPVPAYPPAADFFQTDAGFEFQVTNDRIAAVPEPATLALLGVGLAGLGFSKRKRN